MKKIAATLIVGLTLAGLSTPAIAQTVRIKGETVATQKLQSATMTKLMSLFTPATQCTKPTLVEPSTVAIQPRLDKNKKPVALGRVKENWKITGCGESRSYEVIYTLDEKKGTHIAASPIK